MNIHWKDWCWSWNSNILATWCEELTHWKRLWCWEILKAGEEEGDRGWDGWMASPTQRTWVWVNYGSWWWTGRPSVLQSMGSKRVRHNWVTELIWMASLEFWMDSLALIRSHQAANLKGVLKISNIKKVGNWVHTYLLWKFSKVLFNKLNTIDKWLKKKCGI